MVQRGFSDIPVLRAIAARFGPSAFFNTILVRAAGAAVDAPQGSPR